MKDRRFISEDCGVSTPQVVSSLSCSGFDFRANTETREHANTQTHKNAKKTPKTPKSLTGGNSCGLANFEKRSDTWVGNMPCDGRFSPRGTGQSVLGDS